MVCDGRKLRAKILSLLVVLPRRAIARQAMKLEGGTNQERWEDVFAEELLEAVRVIVREELTPP